MNRELSIFVDESGDLGEYDYHAPYYIVSFVFHTQSIDLSSELSHLNNIMNNLGFPNHCVHAGPIIRGEEEYRNVEKQTRQKLLKALMSFVRNADIQIKSFFIEKKHIDDNVEAAGKLGKLISRFIRENYEYFMGFDIIKVYYDNGQVELNKILSSVFNSLLDNVEFKRVLPKDYRLFQVADLTCTIKLAELKMSSHSLSKSEQTFFDDERTLRKNYIKALEKKEFSDR